MKTIDERWRDFAERVIPPHASSAQFYDMRMAFYAGFTSMLDVDEELAHMTDEAAILLLDSYYREAGTFIGSLRKER